MISKSQATWIRKKFDRAMNKADCVQVDNGAILAKQNPPDDDVFYVSWIDDRSDENSCHIRESAFEPKNNPHINADGNFELEDHRGFNTIIAFFTLKHITA